MFAVIIPAHQAEETLDACICGILGSGFAAGEILVVDDGSRDRTAGIARDRDVRVISNAEPMRPARARNHGVEAVEADIILFVDADVVVHGDLRSRLERHFADAAVTAVIGSYDDRPNGGSVVSDYRNLLHHHTHQLSSGEADTFWTGLGAVRRAAFVEVGGLDRSWENIEDVEFGLRLTASGGRILLDPSIQGTHLKVWTPASMFRTDLWGRAVPWSRLLRSGRARTGTLNTTLRHKIAAAGLALIPAGLGAGLLWGPALWLCLLGLCVFFGASLPFLAMLARRRGWGFALRAIPFHMLYYAAAMIGMAKVRLEGPATSS